MVNIVDFCLISILCIEVLVWKVSGFLTTNIISAKIYKFGTVTPQKIYHSLSEIESVQSKLSLMYVCLVCTIIFSS